MAKFTKEMVDDYAEKLLIGLTDEENQMVLEEFNIIDKQIDSINDIEGLNDIEPMTHTLDDFEVFLREDEVIPSININEAFRNAKEVEGREIVVPKVVENE